MYNFHTILYIFCYFIQFGLSQITNTQVNTLEYNEGSNLHIKVFDLQRNDYKTCGESGQCESQGKPGLELLCTIINQTEGNISRQYINATTKNKMSADHVGNWQCTFLLVYTTRNGQLNVDTKTFSANFKVHIIENDEVNDLKWIYIGSAIGILAVIIVVQTGCILYFKKKARLRRSIQSFQSSANVDSPDNAVRYTKMPGQIKMDQLNKEPRESVIYEALENLPIPKPEPPPIDTLPKPGKTESVTQKTLTSKTLPPPTPKKPVKNKNIDNCKAETMSITSLKRIKSRKPQPLPMDDPQMYEVMTPPGSLNKPESGLSRALPGKAILPAQAVPIFPTGNNVPVLPSMIAAAQLKSVNISNKKTVPLKPKQQQQPNKPAPFVLNAIKKQQQVPPVFRKPPAPLPIQPIPVDNGSISSDEEEWTYEPLSQYNQYNIYDNVPR